MDTSDPDVYTKFFVSQLESTKMPNRLAAVEGKELDNNEHNVIDTISACQQGLL